MTPNEYEEGSEYLRRVMGWTIVIVGGAFVAWFGYSIFVGSLRDVVIEVAHNHYASIVGLPCSGLAALFIVLLLRNVAGKIEIKFFGLEFKGAAGPIIMWVICFLALTYGITRTWNLLNTSPILPSVPAEIKK
jgi:hypothetical protein